MRIHLPRSRLEIITNHWIQIKTLAKYTSWKKKAKCKSDHLDTLSRAGMKNEDKIMSTCKNTNGPDTDYDNTITAVHVFGALPNPSIYARHDFGMIW